MHLLESSFNLDASTIMYNIEQGREILLEQANVALFSGTMIDEELQALMKCGIMMIQKLEEMARCH
jgi:hypothetical protein